MSSFLLTAKAGARYDKDTTQGEKTIKTPTNNRLGHNVILASRKDSETEETQFPAFGSSDAIREHSLPNKKLTDDIRQDRVDARNQRSR